MAKQRKTEKTVIYQREKGKPQTVKYTTYSEKPRYRAPSAQWLKTICVFMVLVFIVCMSFGLPYNSYKTAITGVYAITESIGTTVRVIGSTLTGGTINHGTGTLRFAIDNSIVIKPQYQNLPISVFGYKYNNLSVIKFSFIIDNYEQYFDTDFVKWINGGDGRIYIQKYNAWGSDERDGLYVARLFNDGAYHFYPSNYTIPHETDVKLSYGEIN